MGLVGDPPPLLAARADPWECLHPAEVDHPCHHPLEVALPVTDHLPRARWAVAPPTDQPMGKQLEVRAVTNLNKILCPDILGFNFNLRFR